MFSTLTNWIDRLLRHWFGKRRQASYVVVLTGERSEAEKIARQGKVAVVRKNGYDKWVLMLCPCGCGEIINLNLMSSAQPHWDVVPGKNELTIHPSIIVTSCRSHFWVRDGRVHWCAD